MSPVAGGVDVGVADGQAAVLVEEVEPGGVDGQVDRAADPGLGLGVDPGGPQALAFAGQLFGFDLVLGRLVEDRRLAGLTSF